MRRLDRPLFVRKLVTANIDQNFSSVTLLLHMDGSNGGVTVTDSSSYARIVGIQPNFTTSTAQAKFGSSSGSFPGNAFLQFSAASELDMTTGDWTIEGFVYVTALGSNSIITQKASGTGFYPWQLFYNAAGNLVFRSFDNGTPTLLFTITSSTAMSTGAWNHWAMTRNGSTFTLWLNGASQGTATSSSALYSNASDGVLIGAATGPANPINGYIDEFRITKGVARYLSNFSIPTQAFPNS